MQVIKQIWRRKGRRNMRLSYIYTNSPSFSLLENTMERRGYRTAGNSLYTSGLSTRRHLWWNERTFKLARNWFYWPRMTKAVERKYQDCERCIWRKAWVEKAAELVNIKVYAPMELVCIDFLTLEPNTSSTKNILVVTDHCTKYAQTYPTKDQMVRTVANVLWENFIFHCGFPWWIHSDQGPTSNRNWLWS